MKIDRLIGILSILLQGEKVTAPYLAKKFEVSRRTINRDIENLCLAGVPITTAQGVGGGISIMDGYKMDRTILTSRDMKMILAGLKSLDSVGGSRYYAQLMEKIKVGSSEYVSGNESILIDLSSWYGDSLPPKIDLIQNAIEERRIIRFSYYAPSGDSARRIEPYFLVYKWSSWYVWGWCHSKKVFRMFKLTRMGQLEQTAEVFTAREIAMPNLANEVIFPDKVKVKAVFDVSVKWRLLEEFGEDAFQIEPNGTLLFEYSYDKDNLINWLLSYEDKVTLLEPAEYREKLLHIAQNIKEKYEEK